MPDVEIPCVQCKEIFIFTEKEQENFYQRNMMTPQRCGKCRSKKTAANANRGGQIRDRLRQLRQTRSSSVPAESRAQRDVQRMFSGKQIENRQTNQWIIENGKWITKRRNAFS